MAATYGATDTRLDDLESTGLVSGREIVPAAPTGWSRKAKACILVLAMTGVAVGASRVNLGSSSTTTRYDENATHLVPSAIMYRMVHT